MQGTVTMVTSCRVGQNAGTVTMVTSCRVGQNVGYYNHGNLM